MADDPGEYDFDLELYCIICDRQIDPTSAPPSTDFSNSPNPQPTSPAPSPSLSSGLATSVNTSPAPPNPTPSSSKSSHHPPLHAPKLKRTGSGHSTTSNGAPTTGAGGGGHAKSTTSSGGLKRNKSLGKVHHSAGGAHRRNHSHANLHSLAPMTGTGKKVAVTAVGPAAEREKGKAKAKEEPKEAAPAAARTFNVASTLYCSEECKRVDEARNQLTLTHLGGSNSPSPGPFPFSSPSSTDDFDQEGPYASMARRRSSGVSTTSSTSFAFSSAGERGLSPIMSAAPTSNPTPYLDSSGFPFPSVSSSTSTLARHSPQNAVVSHPSNSSLNSLPSQQSLHGQPPLLNFSSRRQSRGGHSSGAYSYRPSLMERVHSTDSADSAASERNMSRNARSLSIGGGFSGGLFNRVKSIDGLAMMGRNDSDSSDREGRQVQSHRPPSALSSLRSMTPINNGPPDASVARSRPPFAISRYSEPASSHPPSGVDDRPHPTRISSDSQATSQSRSRSRSRQSHHPSLPPSRARSRPPPTTSPLFAGSDPPEMSIGSLPTAFGHRAPSLGSPTSTTSLLRPVPISPDSLLAPRRTSSSASLALLGSSVSKSHDHRIGPLTSWNGLKRTDSTAGLSGLVAVGEMSAPSTSAASLPPSSSSTASTFIPALSTYQQRHPVPTRRERPRRPSSSHSHPHSSPSSATSSFGPSQSSVRTSSSSRRSTAASSDHWQGVMSSSYGSNAGNQSTAMHRTRSGSSSRPDRPSTGMSSSTSGGGGGGGGGSNRIKQGGLTMTPSSTNLTSIAPPSPTVRTTHSTLAPAIPPSGSLNPGLAAIAGGSGSGGVGGSRTWSWTNLHVPTYQALDVSDYRAKKEQTEKAANGNLNEGVAPEVATSPQQKKERKRLFYFSDNGD